MTGRRDRAANVRLLLLVAGAAAFSVGVVALYLLCGGFLSSP